ncbi:DUF5988 family protein [Streptomyces kutzneri]|uniref:DUF5988 family protein n=1 Tax=Streptomyces kutzneri TaxID=3051179 RepID=UPI0028D8AEC3|nr:DUF5988 family protein [Streptomyces sp. DSM 40907]
MATKAVLEGGPGRSARAGRSDSRPRTGPEDSHRGGYEHFKITSRHQDSSEGQLAVYGWWERTEIAE